MIMVVIGMDCIASARKNVYVHACECMCEEERVFPRPIRTLLNRTSELFRNKMVFDRCGNK